MKIFHDQNEDVKTHRNNRFKIKRGKSIKVSWKLLMLHILFYCSLNKSFFGLVAISASSSSGSTPVAVAMPQIPSLVRGSTSAATTSVTGSKTADRTKRVLEAKQIIREADIVCFDVDSTVIQEEGIDELAEYCGKGQEVSNLTKEAMGGSMTFQEALRRRLDIIKPSQRQIREFLTQKPSSLSPGIKWVLNLSNVLSRETIYT